ncbi:unnamed protein product [Rotaria sp. Silwood1]|nr:unnamed protein product [Rotaria sp. Silwood1]CAF1340061.1 unnamed protein product [Rotaria sp. Silwood1]CAF1644018.1 unnamed protein product [Rotaria sp. Silwood1]CAF1644066.1 unnamed protein product [Rotaria sp. Silwood1]CAF3720191.1 unnamed protein product [Rotaria sp. Silwood1]
MRVLGPCIETTRAITPLPVSEPLSSRSCAPDIDLSDETAYVKQKQQLIDNVRSCLTAMTTTRRAADNVCQLYRRDIDFSLALNHLFQVHSTAFYLKAATSAQIKNLLSTGRRLSWPDLPNNINAFRTDVGHEQLFIAQTASAKDISSKIDSATSIAMSSKLAYQLTRLSY